METCLKKSIDSLSKTQMIPIVVKTLTAPAKNSNPSIIFSFILIALFDAKKHYLLFIRDSAKQNTD
jgi:hypothetical protein